MTVRFATEELDVGGQRIPAGARLLLLIGSANRDPLQFTDPDRLDVSLQHNSHIAFGHGIHACLGAPLARLEGEIAIGAPFNRFPNLDLAGPPVRRNQITLRGLEALPVKLNA